MTTPAENLKQFFAKMVHPSFSMLGLGAGETADYVIELMVRFARSDQLYRLRTNCGKPLHSVTDMLMEQASGEQTYRVDREVQVRRHMGDFALFMSGLFRTHVEGGGYLGYYLQEGEASYREVGQRLNMVVSGRVGSSTTWRDNSKACPEPSTMLAKSTCHRRRKADPTPTSSVSSTSIDPLTDQACQ